MADHVENKTLYGLKRMSCVVCKVSVARMGLDEKEMHPTRDYHKYATIKEYLVNTGVEDNVASLLAGVKMGWNVFAGLLPVKVLLFFKPDILYNINLRLFKHLIQWIEDSLKKHSCQEWFYEVWKSL